jgi:transposase
MTLEEQVKFLLEENAFLKKTIQILEKRIADLEDIIRKSQVYKNSSNSSKPPSTDISSPKRNQSLRESSGNKPGGQLGHKGTTLQMSSTPDEIIELNPTCCENCGCSLENEVSYLEVKRQEIDIPPIQAIIKEYRRNSKNCPGCGHHQEIEFPKHIINNIQYGPNIESLVSYLSVYQYLPFRRLKELVNHLFNLGISEGTIDNLLRRMSKKALPVYEQIKESISLSKQVGSDETSAKVNGEKQWIWVWQSVRSTFLTASESRGSKTIDSIFPDGLINSILNTDRWAAQLKTKTAGHQLCISHLQRDLNFIEEVDNIDWAKRFKVLLKKALELKKQLSEYSHSHPATMELEQRVDILLQENIPKNTYHKTYSFQKSLIKHRDSILTFLYNKDTPADNNGSERAIRNVKVKQKISGQFKTGQNRFCVLRSIIDTCKKRNIDIMVGLNYIAHSY